MVKDVDNIVLGGRNKSVELRLDEYFNDADGETLSYTAEQSTTNLVVKHSVADGVLTVTGNSFGLTKLMLTATDARGETAAQSFEILVRDGSRPVDLYPNPVADRLNVRVGADAGELKLKIVSASGSTFYEASHGASNPFSPVTVDMSDAPAGQYTVLVTADGEEYKSFIVKL